MGLVTSILNFRALQFSILFFFAPIIYRFCNQKLFFLFFFCCRCQVFIILQILQLQLIFQTTVLGESIAPRLILSPAKHVPTAWKTIFYVGFTINSPTCVLKCVNGLSNRADIQIYTWENFLHAFPNSFYKCTLSRLLCVSLNLSLTKGSFQQHLFISSNFIYKLWYIYF